MYTINRALALIKPKQPFVDWLNSHPQNAGFMTTLEEARDDCTAILIPEFETDKEARSYIKDLSSDLFEIELGEWYPGEDFWPKKRDFETFLKWFEVEVHTVVIDPYENEIEKEEY